MSQNFKRGRSTLSFKPKQGIGAPNPHGARTARAEAIGQKAADENLFDNRRHEAEVRRSENLAAGLPEDANDPTEEVQRSKSGRDLSYRAPSPSHGEEGGGDGSEDHPAEDAPVEPPRRPKGLIEKARAAVKEVVKKVRQFIQPEPKIVKEVVINAEPLETRVAVLEDSRLEDFTVERASDDRLVGSIFKGKVKNLEDNLKAAFVDIGFEKNAFLHYWDIVPSNFDSSVELVEREGDRQKQRAKPKITQKDVPKLFPPGSEIIVQVTKGAIGTKGPRVTTNLSLPGRYLVLLPNSDQSGISRKIEHGEERQRLKKIVRELTIPEGMGVIIRTAGEGKLRRYFVRDLALLLEEWKEIESRIKAQPLASCVFQEPDLVERTVRDFLTEDVSRIVIDDPKQFERVKGMISKISSRSTKKIHFYNEAQPLFDRFNISRQLEQAFSRQVALKSGGYLVIDETEALVAIDVNSGRSTREHNIEDTALRTNLEASDEVARQLRLRDLAGLIVVDFIDMEENRNNRSVERRMKDALKNDRARIQVGRISHFGLLEMSRQRIRTSVLESSTEKCPACGGSGHVRSVASVALQLLRSLEETLIKGATHSLIVRTRAEVAIYVLNHKRAHLRSLEERFRVTLTITTDPSITGQVSFAIDRGEQVHTVEAAKALLAAQPVAFAPMVEEEDDEEFEDEAESEAEGESGTESESENESEGDTESETETAEAQAESPREDGTGPRRKRRRRRGRRGVGEGREPREPGSQREGAVQAHEGERSDEHAGDDHDQPQENGSEPASENGERSAQNGDNGRPPRDGEPRRRRRGRRGGRRNRRDRDPNSPGDNGAGENGGQDENGAPQYAQDNDIVESTPTPRIEPSAVGQELGSMSRDIPERQPTAMAQPVPAIEAEAPKRRSTVREPAPTFTSGQGFAPVPMPQAAPAVVSTSPAPATEAADETKPRKTGWWAKRLLGE